MNSHATDVAYLSGFGDGAKLSEETLDRLLIDLQRTRAMLVIAVAMCITLSMLYARRFSPSG
jgi:hypothetical protein